MWDTVLPAPLAAAGRFLETRVAPPLYSRTRLVTLSQSSKVDIVHRLRLDANRVDVVPPGVDAHFIPGIRSQDPLVVAVGRLVPYKRFDELIEVLIGLKARHPKLRAVIAGEGSERHRLEDLVDSRGARAWLDLPGRIDSQALVKLYQSAWVLASSSAFEGWGLTISEAAACATPCVASPIAGHFDAVDEPTTGFLAQPGPPMLERLDLIVTNAGLRHRMQAAALAKARSLRWDDAANAILRILVEEATLYR
jgi:glycosyltransferase involved in cell wall biosynthesis